MNRKLASIQKISNLSPIENNPDLLRNPEVFSEPFYVTEKLDGTSSTFFYRDGEFGVCVRNFRMKFTDNNIFWDVAKSLNLEEKLNSLGKNIALQGEILGFKVQGNPYNLEDVKFYLYNVYFIDESRHCTFDELLIYSRELGLDTVPILY
jgi:ATP-dependent RNA circularization protein (DNA/RNA ligase family)